MTAGNDISPPPSRTPYRPDPHELLPRWCCFQYPLLPSTSPSHRCYQCYCDRALDPPPPVTVPLPIAPPDPPATSPPPLRHMELAIVAEGILLSSMAISKYQLFFSFLRFEPRIQVRSGNRSMLAYRARGRLV